MLPVECYFSFAAKTKRLNEKLCMILCAAPVCPCAICSGVETLVENGSASVMSLPTKRWWFLSMFKFLV